MSKPSRILWVPLLAFTLATSGRLFGDSIPVAINFTGAPVTPLIATGTTVNFESEATASIVSGDPNLNASWNPVLFHCFDAIDLTTALDNASFTFTFANGDTLFGNSVADDSAVLATFMGPYTETLTFTGGTGAFLGATGAISGGGLITATGFTLSGTGTLTAPGLVATTPEPGTWLLVLSGCCSLAALGVRKGRDSAKKCY